MPEGFRELRSAKSLRQSTSCSVLCMSDYSPDLIDWPTQKSLQIFLCARLQLRGRRNDGRIVPPKMWCPTSMHDMRHHLWVKWNSTHLRF